MESIRTENVRTQSIKNLYHDLSVDVLRLDLVHPVVSGNKWFKLRFYIQRAQQEKKKGIVTFGGAFSNHIIATAVACLASGLQSAGIIRGERPARLSQTLIQAEEAGMQLHFISREAYRIKNMPSFYSADEWLFVDEGGYGDEGMRGAGTIAELIPPRYDQIICGVGTGTTLAGLISSTTSGCVGIAVVNDPGLHQRIENLLPAHHQKNYTLSYDYLFGGYAKRSERLIEFMNAWYNLTAIPTDFVYTAKVFFAADAMIRSGYFPHQSKILVIHSGGLQGNTSLPKGTLIF